MLSVDRLQMSSGKSKIQKQYLEEFKTLEQICNLQKEIIKKFNSIQNAFCHLDQNQDGILYMNNFSHIIMDNGLPGDQVLHEHMFRFLDIDQNGKINLEDWTSGYKRIGFKIAEIKAKLSDLGEINPSAPQTYARAYSNDSLVNYTMSPTPIENSNGKNIVYNDKENIPRFANKTTSRKNFPRRDFSDERHSLSHRRTIAKLTGRRPGNSEEKMLTDRIHPTETILNQNVIEIASKSDPRGNKYNLPLQMEGLTNPTQIKCLYDYIQNLEERLKSEEKLDRSQFEEIADKIISSPSSMGSIASSMSNFSFMQTLGTQHLKFDKDHIPHQSVSTKMTPIKDFSPDANQIHKKSYSISDIQPLPVHFTGFISHEFEPKPEIIKTTSPKFNLMRNSCRDDIIEIYTVDDLKSEPKLLSHSLDLPLQIDQLGIKKSLPHFHHVKKPSISSEETLEYSDSAHRGPTNPASLLHSPSLSQSGLTQLEEYPEKLNEKVEINTKHSKFTQKELFIRNMQEIPEMESEDITSDRSRLKSSQGAISSQAELANSGRRIFSQEPKIEEEDERELSQQEIIDELGQSLRPTELNDTKVRARYTEEDEEINPDEPRYAEVEEEKVYNVNYDNLYGTKTEATEEDEMSLSATIRKLNEKADIGTLVTPKNYTNEKFYQELEGAAQKPNEKDSDVNQQYSVLEIDVSEFDPNPKPLMLREMSERGILTSPETAELAEYSYERLAQPVAKKPEHKRMKFDLNSLLSNIIIPRPQKKTDNSFDSSMVFPTQESELSGIFSPSEKLMLGISKIEKNRSVQESFLTNEKPPRESAKKQNSLIHHDPLDKMTFPSTKNGISENIEKKFGQKKLYAGTLASPISSNRSGQTDSTNHFSPDKIKKIRGYKDSNRVSAEISRPTSNNQRKGIFDSPGLESIDYLKSIDSGLSRAQFSLKQSEPEGMDAIEESPPPKVLYKQFFQNSLEPSTIRNFTISEPNTRSPRESIGNIKKIDSKVTFHTFGKTKNRVDSQSQLIQTDLNFERYRRDDIYNLVSPVNKPFIDRLQSPPFEIHPNHLSPKARLDSGVKKKVDSFVGALFHKNPIRARPLAILDPYENIPKKNIFREDDHPYGDMRRIHAVERPVSPKDPYYNQVTIDSVKESLEESVSAAHIKRKYEGIAENISCFSIRVHSPSPLKSYYNSNSMYLDQNSSLLDKVLHSEFSPPKRTYLINEITRLTCVESQLEKITNNLSHLKSIMKKPKS